MKTFRASTIALLTGLASASLSVPAFAQKADNGIYGIYGSLGTEGLGLGVSFAGRPGWNLRAELNTLNADIDRTIDGDKYNLKVRHISQSLLYDYRPLDGSFRLTTGVGINQSRLDFNGQIFGNFGPLAPSSAEARGRIELPSVMPYLGLGMGLGKTRSGIGFYADLGAYLGSPKLRSFETNPSNINTANERRSLEEDLRSIKFYPVGKIGINYQF